MVFPIDRVTGLQNVVGFLKLGAGDEIEIRVGNHAVAVPRDGVEADHGVFGGGERRAPQYGVEIGVFVVFADDESLLIYQKVDFFSLRLIDVPRSKRLRNLFVFIAFDLPVIGFKESGGIGMSARSQMKLM